MQHLAANIIYCLEILTSCVELFAEIDTGIIFERFVWLLVRVTNLVELLKQFCLVYHETNNKCLNFVVLVRALMFLFIHRLCVYAYLYACMRICA